MSENVEVNATGAPELWQTYVHPRARSVNDLIQWKTVLGSAYGIRFHLLTAGAAPNCTGCLGLYEIRHPLFGHYLTTAPFSNDGGLFAETPTTQTALLSRAKSLADELDVKYLAIRTRDNALDGFTVDRRYFTAVVDLLSSEVMWEKHLPGKTRNQVRKGTKSGFTVQAGNDQIDDFFVVFHQHMRDLGSPGHSREFYRCVLKELGDSTDVIVIRKDKDIVAGALVFFVNDTAMNYHAVSLREYNRLCPNYLLYWTMLKRSADLGYKLFDMGRSLADSPQLAFKRNWKPRVVPLHYNYYLRKRQEIPFLDPRNSVYSSAIRLWRNLPLSLTRAIGPRLIRGLA